MVQYSLKILASEEKATTIKKYDFRTRVTSTPSHRGRLEGEVDITILNANSMTSTQEIGWRAR